MSSDITKNNYGDDTQGHPPQERGRLLHLSSKVSKFCTATTHFWSWFYTWRRQWNMVEDGFFKCPKWDMEVLLNLHLQLQVRFCLLQQVCHNNRSETEIGSPQARAQIPRLHQVLNLPYLINPKKFFDNPSKLAVAKVSS